MAHRRRRKPLHLVVPKATPARAKYARTTRALLAHLPTVPLPVQRSFAVICRAVRQHDARLAAASGNGGNGNGNNKRRRS